MNTMRNLDLTSPSMLQPGDVFVVQGGPHSGRTARVQGPGPVYGLGGTIDVPVKLLDTVRVNLDHDQRVSNVLRLPDQDTGPE